MLGMEEETTSSNRVQGEVKWFNSSKGYGFITYGDQDIFVHYSEIQKDGYKSLSEHMKVEFTLTEGPKGLLAKNVVVIPN